MGIGEEIEVLGRAVQHVWNFNESDRWFGLFLPHLIDVFRGRRRWRFEVRGSQLAELSS